MVEVDTTAIKIDNIDGVAIKKLFFVKAGVPTQEGVGGISSSSIFENYTTPEISTNVVKLPIADIEVYGDVQAMLGIAKGEDYYGGGKGGPIFAGPPIIIPDPAPGATIALGPLKLDAVASAAIANGVSSTHDMKMVFIKGQ